MRRQSKKRTNLMLAAMPIRDALILRMMKCEVCGCNPKQPRPGPRELSQLCCHEIASGPLRHKALDKPYALLVLCWWHNLEMTDRRKWPEVKQLSVLKRSRPDDYDLVSYNALVNERAPHRITEDEVSGWIP